MKLLDDELLADLSSQAAKSSRLRKNFNFHPQLTDPIQRLCNALEPGTYIRPHRHSAPARWEFFIMLKGSGKILLFNDDSTVKDIKEISSSGPLYGVEVPPDTWHTIIAQEPNTIFFEIKEGPYSVLIDKGFADWSPEESDEESKRYVKLFETACIGDKMSSNAKAQPTI